MRAVFDFDGTLFDTFPGVSRCINLTLSKMNRPPFEDAVLRTFLGPPIFVGFSTIADMNEKDAERAVELFHAEYDISGVFESCPYEGIPQLLERLKQKGITLAIASSKPQEMIEKLLKTHSLEKYFSKAVGVSSGRRDTDKSLLLKAAAEGESAVMIGDRHFDIDAAVKLGFKSIGVTYGFGTKEELLGAGASEIADSPMAIESALEKISAQR